MAMMNLTAWQKMMSKSVEIPAAGPTSEEIYDYQNQAGRLLTESDQNLVVVAPTGAGKTAVGITALRRYGKGVYVAPTRALCGEKFDELKREFPGARIVLGNRDYSLSAEKFRQAQFRVVTPWVLGLMLANDPSFGAHCPVVVVDEIHMLGDQLDATVTQLMLRFPSVRIVGLSATVHEDDEPKIAAWLNALVVKGEHRPVPLLTRLMHFDADINDAGEEVSELRVVENGSVVEVETLPGSFGLRERVGAVVRHIRAGGDDAPVLIYTPYRARARALAEMFLGERESHPTNVELAKIARSLPAEASDCTDTLKEILPKGIGMHHAGMSQEERDTVFRLALESKLDIVVGCETLVVGINLPFRHVVPELMYLEVDGGNGQRQLMDCSRFWQLAGRAGRPQFDKAGHLWIPVGSQMERTEVEEVILKNKASRMVSRVYDEYFLASLMGSLILAGFNTPARMAKFLKATFFGTTLQDNQPLTEQFERLVTMLVEQRFAMEFAGRLILTDRGHRLARLGFHPGEYQVIEALLESESASYEDWVKGLVQVCAEHVIGQPATEEETQDVVTYGMTATMVKTSHHVRELVDYLSRLFELVLSLTHFNQVGKRQYLSFKNDVVDRFQFGQQRFIAALAGITNRAAARRVLRNMGPSVKEWAESGQAISPELSAQLVKCLWHHTRPKSNEAIKLARLLGVTEQTMNRLVRQLGQTTTNNNSDETAEKEVA